eukprot:191325-Amphidinium_carterae.1
MGMTSPVSLLHSRMLSTHISDSSKRCKSRRGKLSETPSQIVTPTTASTNDLTTLQPVEAHSEVRSQFCTRLCPRGGAIYKMH